MRKPTGRPVGRPWTLTPEQEQRVYAEYTAAKHGKRFKVLDQARREFRCSFSTLEKAMRRQRDRQFAAFVDRHVTRNNSHPGALP